jgi:DNA-binding transcriptional LysR family regulator
LLLIYFLSTPRKIDHELWKNAFTPAAFSDRDRASRRNSYCCIRPACRLHLAPLKVYGAENDTTFVVDSIGSLPALDRLRSDEIDLAIVAVPEGDEVPRDEFNIYPFAYDAAVLVVNESNPIDEISVARSGAYSVPTKSLISIHGASSGYLVGAIAILKRSSALAMRALPWSFLNTASSREAS